MKWINVDDKLPEYNDDVLVIVEDMPFEFKEGFYHYAIGRLCPQFDKEPFWMNAEGFGALENEESVVSYWIPLPKPPTGSE